MCNWVRWNCLVALGVIAAAPALAQARTSLEEQPGRTPEGHIRRLIDSIGVLATESAQLAGYIALSERSSALDLALTDAVPPLQRGRALARRIGTPAQRAKLNYNTGKAALRLSNFALATDALREARQAYRVLGDSMGVWRVRLEEAKVMRDSGAAHAAAEVLLGLRESFARAGATHEEVYALSMLALIAIDASDAPRAVRYAQYATASARAIDDDRLLARAQRELAYAFQATGQFTEALAVIDSVLAYDGPRGADLPETTLAHTTRGGILRHLGRYREALMAYDRIKPGLPQRNTMFYLGSRAEVLMFLGREQEARDLVDTVMARTRRGGFGVDYLAAAHFMRAAVAASPEVFPAVLADIERATELQDSLTAASNAGALAELETQYRTAAKDAEIARQAETLAQQRSRVAWIAVGLALALLAVAIVGYLAFQLRRRNREREMLIKEVHHRVKNNLQVLSSLLYLQGRHLARDAESALADPDGRAQQAIQQSQSRVEAMGLIHQQLYTDSASMAAVEMPKYLEELGESLLDTFGPSGDGVEIAYTVDDLALDVDTAIPLGLIVNELVTNSLKYAFADDNGGTVDIELTRTAPKQLLLRVSDNGRASGLTNFDNAPKGTGFGGSLVDMLSKKLGGVPRVISGSLGYSTEISIDA